MKVSSREDVVIKRYHTNLAGETKYSEETKKNRCVYRRKDGTEYVHDGELRRAADGTGYVEKHSKQVQALNMLDLVKKVKETGGSITILPP